MSIIRRCLVKYLIFFKQFLFRRRLFRPSMTQTSLKQKWFKKNKIFNLTESGYSQNNLTRYKNWYEKGIYEKIILHTIRSTSTNSNIISKQNIVYYGQKHQCELYCYLCIQRHTNKIMTTIVLLVVLIVIMTLKSFVKEVYHSRAAIRI